MKFASLALCLSIIFLGGPALAASPPPLDPIIINFQGRIEVNDVGYTGASWFAFTIGNAGITESYWHGRASTTCSYGIYNILLGQDTDEALTSDIFNQNTDLYMRVAFTNDTDGLTNWEQLTPDQQITGVAFAVNADLLDGRESPDSDIVGVDDTQTLTNKILGSDTYTTYFRVLPAADPGAVPEGYLWYDSANHALKVRVADSKWVVLTGDTGAISNVPAAGNVANTLRDDGAAWQSSNLLQVWDYGSGTGAVDIEGGLSFNDSTGTYITQDSVFSNEYLDFYVGDVHQFRMTNFGKFECFTSPAGDTTPVIRWKQDQDTGIGHTWTGGTDNTNELSVIAGGTRVMTVGSGTAANPYVRVEVDGAAGNPALEIGTDDGAGIYQGLTGSSLSFATQSTVVMHINNKQQVKIGRDATFDDATLYFQVDGKIKVNQDMPDQSLWISQDANTNAAEPSNTVGGALHVYNQSNTGTAISAYSNVANPLTPLVWLRVGTDFNDQPVLRLRGASAVSNPLYIEQQSEPGASPAAGHIYMDADDKLLKYFNGVDWVELTASGGGNFATRALDNLASVAINASLLPGADDSIDLGDAAHEWQDLFIDGTANIDSLVADTADINAGTIDGTAIGQAAAGLGSFTSLSATTSLASASGAAIDEFSTDGTLGGDSDTAVPTEQAVKTYVDGQFASQSWTSGTGAATYVTYWTGENTISGESPFAYDPATDTLTLAGNMEVTTDTAADALNIDNDGTGSAISVSHSAAAQEKAVWVENESTQGALWIRQAGDIANSTVDDSEGGALHVYNDGNAGSAITAYSNQTATTALVWFRASYQPVLRVEGLTNRSNPFWLVPQAAPAGAIGYTVQTGEMYMGTDGSLNYYKGDGWERLVGRWTVETGARAGNDAFAVTAQRNFNEGRPLRYRGDASDPWLYGMVAAYAGGTVTVAGAALPNPLAEIEVGKPELIRQINFFEPGNLVQGDDFMSPNSWEMQDGYIVRATAKVETADDADAHIAIGVGAAGADLISAPGYLNLAQSTAKVATGIDINTANYSLAFGDKIFVNVDEGGEPGNNLSVTLQVVTP